VLGAGLTFVWQSPDSGIGSSPRPRIPGISDLMQPLEPGPWAVHVRAQEATLRTVKFTVEAGKTTDVVIQLTGL
jgi:hypothetical protein